MSLPNCLRNKNAARRGAREREKAKAEFLAKLEEKYKKAIENSSNKELVAKYKEMIAIKELYEKEANADLNKIHEMAEIITQYRNDNFGVDEKDIESIELTLKEYGSAIFSSEQENEPEK